MRKSEMSGAAKDAREAGPKESDGFAQDTGCCRIRRASGGETIPDVTEETCAELADGDPYEWREGNC